MEQSKENASAPTQNQVGPTPVIDAELERLMQAFERRDSIFNERLDSVSSPNSPSPSGSLTSSLPRSPSLTSIASEDLPTTEAGGRGAPPTMFKADIAADSRNRRGSEAMCLRSASSGKIAGDEEIAAISDGVAVLTSGGDSQGMNAALRGIVRTALRSGACVFGIREGYEGLIHGNVVPLGWHHVAGTIQLGGTFLGTARSKEMPTREGKKKAVLTLVKHNISKLVVIGGDGSLTGAYMLRKEWRSLLEELAKEGRLTEKEIENRSLNIVGLVGSIDNDMFGTDMTIGADTALNRIIEACDSLNSTAASHKRSFVVEVMGRNCGWLALMAAIATGADFVFIPEIPPPENWREILAQALLDGRSQGRRLSMIIVAEGALDIHGKPIPSNDVRQAIEELDHDARITTLGHVQRGGRPCAYDRIMSTRLGAKAVDTIIAAKPTSQDQLVGTLGCDVMLKPLLPTVESTRQIGVEIKNLRFTTAAEMRGSAFQEAFKVFLTTSRPLPRAKDQGLRVLIMHAGAASPGMNAAVRAATRLALDKGHTVFGAKLGFVGLMAGDIQELTWMAVNGWTGQGGTFLGTSRRAPKGPKELQIINDQLEAFGIHCIVVIGGWEALKSVLRFEKHKDNFPRLKKVVKVLVPASISNNLPATEYTIGSDTALNSIIASIDRIKQSAIAADRVFVIEVMGGNCGYLALMSAVATGAEVAYMPEDGMPLSQIVSDCHKLRRRFEASHKSRERCMGLVIVNEVANPTYNTDFLCSVLTEEGRGAFDVRKSVLGHLQQGGDPSPLDRIRATQMATFAINYVDECLKAGEKVAEMESMIVGELHGLVQLTPLSSLPDLIDTHNRRPKVQWWRELKDVADKLSWSPDEVERSCC